MNMRITPTILSGKVKIISSKSQAHRMLICAALANSPSELLCEKTNDDILATIDCLNAIGANITVNGEKISVKPISGRVDRAKLCVRESGSTLRFILPIICALGIQAEIEMLGRLSQRPLNELSDELIKKGIRLKREKNRIYTQGKLSGGEYFIPGNISSQYITGLLFAFLCIKEPCTLTVVGEMQSYSYVDMTIKAMQEFGVMVKREGNLFSISEENRPFGRKIRIEGDWSNAAFWICAGALSEEGITVTNIDYNSTQGDKAIIDIVKDFGAKVIIGENEITVKKGELNGVKIDAGNIPDIIPVISALACAAKGDTVIQNASRLRIKESDRLAAIYELMEAMGADYSPTDDGIIIHGGTKLHGAEVSSHDDHRMAMTAAVMSALSVGDVVVMGSEAVKKSYPDFWKVFNALGGRAERMA